MANEPLTSPAISGEDFGEGRLTRHNPYRIHLWYVYLHFYHKNQPNVGKYTIHGYSLSLSSAIRFGYLLWAIVSARDTDNSAGGGAQLAMLLRNRFSCGVSVRGAKLPQCGHTTWPKIALVGKTP